MIDLAQKQLSEAIHHLGQELNRGAWLLDRGVGGPAISCQLPSEVQVEAVVTYRAGQMIVESMVVKNAGAQTTTSQESRQGNSTAVEVGNQTSQSTESSQQTQSGQTDSAQSGGDENTTTNTYGEAE